MSWKLDLNRILDELAEEEDIEVDEHGVAMVPGRIYSDDLQDMCLVTCYYCHHRVPYLLIAPHNVKFHSDAPEIKYTFIRHTFHRCKLCHTDLLFSPDVIFNHLIKDHQLTHRQYIHDYKAFMSNLSDLDIREATNLVEHSLDHYWKIVTSFNSEFMEEELKDNTGTVIELEGEPVSGEPATKVIIPEELATSHVINSAEGYPLAMAGCEINLEPSGDAPLNESSFNDDVGGVGSPEFLETDRKLGKNQNRRAAKRNLKSKFVVEDTGNTNEMKSRKGKTGEQKRKKKKVAQGKKTRQDGDRGGKAKIVGKLRLMKSMVVRKSENGKRCPECGKVLNTRTGMAFHRKCHRLGKTVQCPQCPKRFYTKSNLKLHTSVQHNAGAVFPCDVCHQEFPRYKDRVRHVMVVHKRERLTVCSVCEEEVPRHYLATHSLSHNRHLMRYGCSVCQSRFVSVKDLMLHNRSHTGERPFACQHCPRKLRSRQSLKRHLKRQHGIQITADIKESTVEFRNSLLEAKK